MRRVQSCGLLGSMYCVAAVCGAAGAQCYTYEPMLRAAGQPQGLMLAVFDPDGPGADMLVGAGRLSLDTAGPAQNIAAYDGEAWRDIGAGLDGPVNEMVVWGSRLVITGGFTRMAGQACNGLAVWDGTEWHALGADLTRSGVRSAALSVAVRGADLFVTGDITHAGGTPVSFLARFDGNQWHDVDGGIDSPGARIVEWNGRVFLHDWTNLRHAGGISVLGGAAWTEAGWERVDGPANVAGVLGSVGDSLYVTTEAYAGSGLYNSQLRANTGSGWLDVEAGSRSADGLGVFWAVQDGAVYRVRDQEDLSLFSGFRRTVMPLLGTPAAPAFVASGFGVDDWTLFRGRWHVSGRMAALNGAFATPVSALDGDEVEPIWPDMVNPEVSLAASELGRFVVQAAAFPVWQYRSRLLRRVGTEWVTDLELDSDVQYLSLGLSDRTAVVRTFEPGRYSYLSLEGGAWVPAPALDGLEVSFKGSWRGEVIGTAITFPGLAPLGLGIVSGAGFTALPPGAPAATSEVLDVGGDLIAIDRTAGAPMVASFDGNIWSTIGTDRVTAAASHGGLLYVLANSRSGGAGLTRYDLRWWDGSAWG